MNAKGLQNRDKNCFRQNVKIQQQLNTKSNIKIILIESGTSRTPVGCVASGPTSHIKLL